MHELKSASTTNIWCEIQPTHWPYATTPRPFLVSPDSHCRWFCPPFRCPPPSRVGFPGEAPPAGQEVAGLPRAGDCRKRRRELLCCSHARRRGGEAWRAAAAIGGDQIYRPQAYVPIRVLQFTTRRPGEEATQPLEAAAWDPHWTEEGNRLDPQVWHLVFWPHWI